MESFDSCSCHWATWRVMCRTHYINGATKTTPFELVYGQEAVLPIEVNLAALRFAKQNDLSAEDYCSLMMDNVDEVANKRVIALR